MNYNGQTPRFKNDYTTKGYTFLGNFTRKYDNRDFDLYFYQGEHRQTVIGKCGDEDHEYTSGLCFARPESFHAELYEARLRAEALGINVKEDGIG